MFGVPMIRLRGGVRQSPDLVRLRAWLSAGQPCLVCLIRDIWGGVLILYEVSFCLTILLPYICKCIVSQLINLLFPQIQSLSPPNTPLQPSLTRVRGPSARNEWGGATIDGAGARFGPPSTAQEFDLVRRRPRRRRRRKIERRKNERW